LPLPRRRTPTSRRAAREMPLGKPNGHRPMQRLPSWWCSPIPWPGNLLIGQRSAWDKQFRARKEGPFSSARLFARLGGGPARSPAESSSSRSKKMPRKKRSSIYYEEIGTIWHCRFGPSKGGHPALRRAIGAIGSIVYDASEHRGRSFARADVAKVSVTRR